MRIRRLALLASILVVCLLLLTLQTRGRASGAADLVARVTTPVQKTLAAIHRGDPRWPELQDEAHQQPCAVAHGGQERDDDDQPGDGSHQFAPVGGG